MRRSLPGITLIAMPFLGLACLALLPASAWQAQNFPGVDLATNQTINGTKTFSAQIISTLATGTAPFSIASTTNVANLNASSLNGATFAAPGAIGTTTPAAATFTTITEVNLLVSNTAPTIAGAGCGGSAASIVSTPNGTAAFDINVGTAPTTACTFTLPSANRVWNCFATDVTTNSTTVFLQKQTGTRNQTSATITNFSDVAAASNFTASDILEVSCFGQ